MSDSSSCSTCQFIVEQGNGTPWVVATGSAQNWYDGYYDAVLHENILIQFGGLVSYNAWTDHFSAVNVTYHMWARRPCPGGGFGFSQTLTYTYPGNQYGHVYGELLTIDASHCQPQLQPAARATNPRA